MFISMFVKKNARNNIINTKLVENLIKSQILRGRMLPKGHFMKILSKVKIKNSIKYKNSMNHQLQLYYYHHSPP